jgi:competence protein ComGC
MLVVLFIIGIIIAIALPNFLSATKKANLQADKANRRMIMMQVENFYLDHGTYPNSIHQLVQAKYLRSVPKCPGDAGSYQLINKSGEMDVTCK